MINTHVQGALKISQLLPVIKKNKINLGNDFPYKEYFGTLNLYSTSYYYFNITTAAL